MVCRAVALIVIIRVDPYKQNNWLCHMYSDFTIALHSKVIIKKLMLWMLDLGPCLRLVMLRRCDIESEDSSSELMAA